MTWKARLGSGALAYTLGLVAFYPLLVLHFLRHHAAAGGPAILSGVWGHHSLDASLFAVAFFTIGAAGPRRILSARAGRAVLLPTLLGATLGLLVVAAGPEQALAVAYVSAALGFCGALFLSPFERARLVPAQAD